MRLQFRKWALGARLSLGVLMTIEESELRRGTNFQEPDQGAGYQTLFEKQMDWTKAPLHIREVWLCIQQAIWR